MDEFAGFSLSILDKVAVVSLNRPAARNAMNEDIWRELPLLFRALDDRCDVRAAILRGEGAHFSSGIDLALLQSLAPSGDGDPARRQERLRRAILRLQQAVNVLEEVRFPVIAAVQGACLGAGLDLVAAADIRIAAAHAFFRIEEINIGLVADLGSLQRLPRLMPPGVVRDLALTGRSLDAEEALRWGFVSAILPDRAALDARALELARQIAAKSPLAVAGSKAVLNHARDHAVADGLDYVATWNAGQLSSDDVLRSLAAVRGKTGAEYGDLLE